MLNTELARVRIFISSILNLEKSFRSVKGFSPGRSVRVFLVIGVLNTLRVLRLVLSERVSLRGV